MEEHIKGLNCLEVDAISSVNVIKDSEGFLQKAIDSIREQMKRTILAQKTEESELARTFHKPVLNGYELAGSQFISMTKVRSFLAPHMVISVT